MQNVSSGPTQTHLTNKKRLVLEVEFVKLPIFSADSDALENSWQRVDETRLDPEVRHRLIANGIRAGIVLDVHQFRQGLQELSAEEDVLDTFLNQASIASSAAQGQQRIPMRYGRRYELPVCNPGEGEQVTLLQLEDETIGRTLTGAQYLLAMTGRETSISEQIQLRVRPEVQYGESKPKFVTSDTALRIDSRRETWSIEPLEMELTLQEGETITIAPTLPLKGLAKQMLSSAGPDQQTQQTIILIRIAQVPTAIDQL